MAEQSAASRPHVVVSVAGTRLAIDAGAVLAGGAELASPARLAVVPLAPTIIAGLTSFDGAVVAVIDLRTALGTSDDRDPEHAAPTVFVRTDRGPIGLQVDAVEAPQLDISLDDLHPIPLTMVASARTLLRGIHQADRELVAVLDVDAVMDVARGDEAEGRSPAG